MLMNVEWCITATQKSVEKELICASRFTRKSRLDEPSDSVKLRKKIAFV